MLTRAVRRTFGVGHDGRNVRVQIELHRRRAAPGPRRRRGGATDVVDLRFPELEADRLREVEDLGHDPVQAPGLFIDVGKRFTPFGRRDLIAPQRAQRGPG
jgi:hypothetical protein